MKRVVMVASLLLAVMAAGCLDGDDPRQLQESEAPPATAEDTFEATPPEDPGSDSSAQPGEHGDPQWDVGPVVTSFQPGQGGWRASQAIMIENDFGGAAWASLDVDFSAGSLIIEPWGEAGYAVAVELHATGLTQDDAQENLGRMHLTHEDVLSDRLQLTTAVEREQQPPGLVNVNPGRQWADVWIRVPASPGYDVAVDVSSADVAIQGLAGHSLLVDTSSGDLSFWELTYSEFLFDSSSGSVSFSGRADSVMGDTSSGDVVLEGVFNDITLDGSSATLAIDATPAASGGFVVDSSSGDVSILVPDASRHGYDVLAGTSSGDITVDLADTQTMPSDEDEAQVRSVDFEGRVVQTSMVLDTSSGDITVSN